MGAWATPPLLEPALAADTGALAVGATWIGPVRPLLCPWLVLWVCSAPPAAGVWVTLPLLESGLAAEAGAFAVGATWIAPVRPDWLLPLSWCSGRWLRPPPASGASG